MALSQKQKDFRDNKVEKLSEAIAEKQRQLTYNDLQAQELHDKIQGEIDELLLSKKAFEDLK